MKLHKLKKTDEFSSVFSFRKRIYGICLIANIKPNQFEYHRFGLVVSKKIAKQAVKRNYMKRVLRTLIAVNAPVIRGCDVVLQVRKAFSPADFHAIELELSSLLAKINKHAASITES